MISQHEDVGSGGGGEGEGRTGSINNAPVTLLIRTGIFRNGVAEILVCWLSCRRTTAALMAPTKDGGAQLHGTVESQARTEETLTVRRGVKVNTASGMSTKADLTSHGHSQTWICVANNRKVKEKPARQEQKQSVCVKPSASLPADDRFREGHNSSCMYWFLWQ